ncbi:MAG: BlaI/MecI/CopY family transcriptional regulator [Xanthomonadales bacterium]|nr:BlaI/MecI/CopY family transcriptional regulator [Xanthomonadales bacterium]
MPKPDIELTEAEWRVIKAVWEREPCTAPEVQGRVAPETGWTYSTVRTLLDRMVGKGLLSAVKEGKLTWFRSRVTRGEAQEGEVRYALRHAFDGALTPMVQCLLDTRGLSSRDLDELERLLREKRRRTET